MEKMRFMMIGAHPDDCDLRCGGLAMHLVQKGHEVLFVSVTDGGAGHHEMSREELILRRAEESKAAGLVYGVQYDVMPFPDGRLEASLEVRDALMRKIRAFDPHVIFTHRTCDYHPDHRACGQLVMDCSYLVGVPLYCPDAPCMTHMPVILSMWDEFTRPVPFKPDLVVPVDDVADRKTQGTLCHVSQFYEWLPWCDHWPQVQAADSFEKKTELLHKQLMERFAHEAKMYADITPEGCVYSEVYEWNEYGAPLTDEMRHILVDPV